MKLLALILMATLLSACDEDAAAKLPPPAQLTHEANGYYCQMMILMHEGPKGQVFLADTPEPLWFGQVRDSLAYLKSPEQEGEIVVIYVSDMGEAPSYAEPGAENWINAKDAYYVVGSDAVGGMGAPEVVPFGDRAKAEEFAANRGGTVLKLNDIPAETVLAPVDLGMATSEN